MEPMADRRAAVTLPTDTQILISRHFDATPALVFRAYTTPELVSRWWVGRRGVMTSCEIDLRVGGTWRYVMEANGGFEVAFHGVYEEIVADEKLVTSDVFEGMPGAEGRSTTTFDGDAGGTLVRMLVDHPSRELRDAHVASGMEEGLQEAMDALEQLVAGTTA